MAFLFLFSFLFVALALVYERTGSALAGVGACATLVLVGSIVC